MVYFNLRKINIDQYSKSSLQTWNNHNRTRITCYNQLLLISFYGNYAIITLCILERPSSWSTLRIRPSWPQSRVRLRLLLLSSIGVLLVCFGPPSILLFTPNTHVSHSTLPCQLGSLTPMYK